MDSEISSIEKTFMFADLLFSAIGNASYVCIGEFPGNTIKHGWIGNPEHPKSGDIPESTLKLFTELFFEKGIGIKSGIIQGLGGVNLISESGNTFVVIKNFPKKYNIVMATIIALSRSYDLRLHHCCICIPDSKEYGKTLSNFSNLNDKGNFISFDDNTRSQFYYRLENSVFGGFYRKFQHDKDLHRQAIYLDFVCPDPKLFLSILSNELGETIKWSEENQPNTPVGEIWFENGIHYPFGIMARESFTEIKYAD